MKNHTPKGKLVKTGNAEYDTRYYSYKHWRFFGWTGFLTIPIGKWAFVPRVLWEPDEKGFLWLWFHFRWNKSWSYVEREDWKLQNKMNQITNMQIDNAKRTIKGPPGGYPGGVMGTPPYDHDDN